MIEKARETWRGFKRSKPGHRFKEHHYRYQRGYSGRSYLRGFFTIGGGFLVVIGGLVAVPGPGPGWLIILLGLGMVAGESLLFARFLDRFELIVRGLSVRIAGIWRAFPIIVQLSIVLVILACGAAFVYSLIT